MAQSDEGYIVAVLKEKIRDIAARIHRDRPDLGYPEREDLIVRLVVDEFQAEFASRPDLEKQFAQIAAEAFVRSLLD